MNNSGLTIQQAIFLQQLTIFQNLDPHHILELCHGLKLQTLNKGSMIFSQGDTSISMALLVSGRVEIEKVSSTNQNYGLAQLAAPCIVGELAYFTGANRNASARVLDSIEYFEISSDFLFTVFQQNPRGIELFFSEITDRLINNSIHARFSKALGITNSESLKEIIQATQIISIAKGETFIHQHDQADTMAVVLEGRLLVRKKNVTGDYTFVGRIFPGESVGETGLLSPHRQRSAEVVAQRDSKLGVISIEKFEALHMNRPEVLLTLVRTILERVIPQSPI
jgi:CRP-like cAMP-binding protein